jgi:hypothetical protein
MGSVTAVVVGIGLLALASGAQARDSGSISRIRHQEVRPSTARTGLPEVARVTSWAEFKAVPEGMLTHYYQQHEDGSFLRIATEKRDLAGRLLAFRHRYQLSGEEGWTPWLPPQIRGAANASWPDLDAPAGALAETPERDSRVLALIHAESVRANLAATDPPPAREGFKDWNRSGTYEWAIEPSRWTPWAGWLWDFHKGMLWRGYRDPGVSGTRLTPSQDQASHVPAEVEHYYGQLPSDLPSQATEPDSRWLSPLDKWGFWASRRTGQNWKLAPAWEGVSHHTNFAWGGYCNASAASSILWKKPQHGFTDLDLRFDTRDVMGILQAATFRVDYLFYGSRYYGPGDDIRDPSPDRVVDLLHEYIARARLPLIVDVEAADAVGNETAYRFKLVISDRENPRERDGILHIYSVTNHLDDRVGQDADAGIPELAEVNLPEHIFFFTIYLKSDGSLKETKWVEDDFHPDFLWFPTGASDYGPPHRRNPYLKIDLVKELLKKTY